MLAYQRGQEKPAARNNSSEKHIKQAGDQGIGQAGYGAGEMCPKSSE
jgi:hypothetical protein